jgi:O-acetylhomoserine/O-acetylserine sulfhydrylase-like pyridoxal-dependent enzyme
MPGASGPSSASTSPSPLTPSARITSPAASGRSQSAAPAAALTTTVLALVPAGDHVIGQKSTYGGTASVLLNLLPRLGVSTTQVARTTGQDHEGAGWRVR